MSKDILSFMLFEAVGDGATDYRLQLNNIFNYPQSYSIYFCTGLDFY